MLWNPVELLSFIIPNNIQKIFEKITVVTEGKKVNSFNMYFTE